MHRRWSVCVSLLACALATSAFGQEALQEVTVSATRVLDDKALANAVSDFVAAHSAPGARVNQIGRWHESVCPQITGLGATFVDYVTRDVLDVARGVGAPTAAPGRKCSVNVEIVFTQQPQALLDHMAKSYRVLLGYYPKSQVAQALKFNRPIQAWYETGTRFTDLQPPVIGMNSQAPGGMAGMSGMSGMTGMSSSSGMGGMTGSASMDGGYSGAKLAGQVNAGSDPQLQTGAQVDSDATVTGAQPSGVAGSRLGGATRSEFMHVLIIADTSQLAHYPLQSIADYVALLSLARMAQLQNCATLPSITDLLANGCAIPVALTAADRAYLHALYAADLEQNLNLERGDLHNRMLQQIQGK